ncbi:MAG: hypothetical protein KF790_06230 [Steroidobacteraceae bacterium]|nr:hypothetical protein [Steroidobacteraceae bacterium]MCW5572316.1 hypothetical protein [Steroidobacteraceae bacterium]
MSPSILRSDPATIAPTLKEAVVDSLLNLTYAQLSGRGPTGEYLFGARPRALLNSGFLLPQRSPSGDDEVTSPIWVSSHGFQMQLNVAMPSEMVIEPRLSLYVRILPREKDLKRPNCRPVFMLRQAVVDELKADRDKCLDEEWERVRGSYASKWKHPEWPEIRKRVVDEVYATKGIPRHLLVSDLPQEDVESDTENAADGDSAGETTKEAIAVLGVEALPIQDEHFEPLKVPHKWMRLEVQIPPLVLDTARTKHELEQEASKHATRMNEAIAKQLAEWACSDDPERGGKTWGYRRQLRIPASQYVNWTDFLDRVRASDLPLAIPNIQLSWDLQLTTDWLDNSKRNLFVALENVSQMPRQHVEETEEAVYLVSLRAQLPVALHHTLKLERIKPSYRYNKYLTYPAMGHNCGVVSVQSPDLRILETTWTPRYTQPRIIPTSVSGVQRQMRRLAEPEGLDGLSPLVPAMHAWLDALPGQVSPVEGLDPSDHDGAKRETEAFRQDLFKWKAEINSIAIGLQCLQESKSIWRRRGPQTSPKAAVYEAWLATNETMADFMRARFGRDDSEWRMFQLAFIIANIPGLASRIPEFSHVYDEHRDDAVSLLYFATGGGKSEAFFGLLVFSLMLDRLRGKHRGVTALIRYPLRLLTIQQAQRCARVLAYAERVRQRHAYAGDALSIGFWVGSGGSPNRHSAKGVQSIPLVTSAPPLLSDEKALREDDAKYSAAMRAWRKLPKCPFCEKDTALRLFIDDGDQTLGHVCTDIQCDSNQGQWKPLPFYIVDEDIYDLAPSVLLGTVDKLALIGHSGRTIRRVYGMLGAAPWVKRTNGRLYIPDNKELAAGPTSKGMEGIYPAYKSGPRIFHDPFPSLIIQDEAHLLDESLGTFAGLFESTLDAVFASLAEPLKELVAVDRQGRRRRAKVIAASATVSDPERQLEHLYQRSIPATQFPEPGPSLYESFYAEPAKAAAEEVMRRANPDIEVASQQARVYSAFMTNGKPHTSTSVAVLSGFHLTITRLFDALTSGDARQLNEVQQQLVDHISSGPLQARHTQAILSANASELATLIDLHRIALTYVTNKKGGDQIMAAEAEETRKRHLNEGIELQGLDTRLITGSVEQGEIQAVVDTAQGRVAPNTPMPPIREQLRSVIATSAISHGVDVDEFNSMFFAGMPSDIAEYIQASSRVGRTHVGFVVLVPTPQRRRDRHIVHVFDIFHRFLERMVQPAAIDRWAERALERVFPSLFQAYLLGVLPSCELLRLPAEEKDNASDFGYIPNVRRALSSRGDAFIDEIESFVELAVGLRDGFAPEGEDHYRRRIDQRTRSLIADTWSSPVWGSGTMDGFFRAQTDPMLKPMTSLRDVDQGGVIQAAFRDAGGHRQSPGDVQLVMDLIRHGVADSGDGD